MLLCREEFVMYGMLNTSKKTAKFEAEEYTYYENSKCIALYDGLPSEQIEWYLNLAEADNDWMRAFWGPFLLILFQKESGRLFITQHLFGNGKNIYIIKQNDTIYFASSLVKIKQFSNILFRLNKAMLPYYFYNGFLPGSHTLIEGVQKLEPGVSILIDNDGIHKRILPFIHSEESETEDLTQVYKEALSNSIYKVTKDTFAPISIALSGGFDSNCILYSIRDQRPKESIHAFSIGGVDGIDETGTAKQIADLYDGVTFSSAFVSPNTLEHLDEIVMTLDGAVYERGIFLQYELAKLLKANSIKHIICGECADQVFHQNTYKSIPNDTFLYGYLDTPYHMAGYVVLKKSRLFMNSFGVDARYPFLTSEMIDVGFRSRMLNGTTKEFHKMQCRELLPPSILNLIYKQGGSTNLASLFPEGFDCAAELSKRIYYSPDFMLTEKYDFDETVRDYYLSLLYLESFEKQFCDL